MSFGATPLLQNSIDILLFLAVLVISLPWAATKIVDAYLVLKRGSLQAAKLEQATSTEKFVEEPTYGSTFSRV